MGEGEGTVHLVSLISPILRRFNWAGRFGAVGLWGLVDALRACEPFLPVFPSVSGMYSLSLIPTPDYFFKDVSSLRISWLVPSFPPSSFDRNAQKPQA